MPVIASGGVGTLEHLVDGIVEGGADAVLAASIFHFREHTIAEAKALMAARGITVRPAARSGPRRVGGRMTQEMEYRRLGRTGLKVSVLSFGSWVTFDNQLKDDLALECMQAAHDAGCNFFDNAEVYAGGESEAIMGRVLAELGWPRWSYVLTTKVFWGIHDGPNMRNTLNRKYLMQAIDGSLERLGVDFVDVLYCHRADPRHAARGDRVGDERHRRRRARRCTGAPASGRPTRSAAPSRSPSATTCTSRSPSSRSTTCSSGERVEQEYARLFADTGYGATIWSPLASGLLTGKYRDGIPEDSRGALAGYGWLAKRLTDERPLAKVERLRPIADELGCSLAQLALAWCTTNPNVSTVITGASRPSQVVENFAALEVISTARRTTCSARIDAAVK